MATALKVVFKFLFEGLIVALAVKYVPVYGHAIDNHEVVVIAIIAAVVSFILERILPSFSLSLGGFHVSGASL
jgi:hypothetical protein